jgi:hypothetical protein
MFLYIQDMIAFLVQYYATELILVVAVVLISLPLDYNALTSICTKPKKTKKKPPVTKATISLRHMRLKDMNHTITHQTHVVHAHNLEEMGLPPRPTCMIQ